LAPCVGGHGRRLGGDLPILTGWLGGSQGRPLDGLGFD
jgi:hypothetical protein